MDLPFTLGGLVSDGPLQVEGLPDVGHVDGVVLGAHHCEGGRVLLHQLCEVFLHTDREADVSLAHSVIPELRQYVDMALSKLTQNHVLSIRGCYYLLSTITASTIECLELHIAHPPPGQK